MIPRLKPFLGKEELAALFRSNHQAVEQFETKFAQEFNASEALSFAYGRSALYAFFKALGIEKAEVIQPAYTCVVVAHATVLSGNTPRFVDINLTDYNMDLDQVAEAINEQTRAVIATHLFGYPLDVVQLNSIIAAAEKRYGHKIWVIQDCAHSFDARWKDEPVSAAGDAALYGLNISKTITSIFGGMLTTNDPETANKIKAWSKTHLQNPGWAKSLRRRLYLLAVYPAFNERLYGLVNWLQDETPLLNRLTKAYHLDEKIHFPPDYLDRLTNIEAQIGLAQLRKYPEIIRRRQEHARCYLENLPAFPGWVLPPWVEGATYSHFVVRVPDRAAVLKAAAKYGVQLGQLIEYSVPHIRAYQKWAVGQEFPNSLLCSQQTINLPVYAHLSHEQRKQVVAAVVAAGKETSHA
jgi:perosamine synthetase